MNAILYSQIASIALNSFNTNTNYICLVGFSQKYSLPVLSFPNKEHFYILKKSKSLSPFTLLQSSLDHGFV